MRVGLIKTAKRHPDADSLYVEEVDVGEEKCRTVISGLVKFISEEDMQNRKAILMCNLKPSKMRGIMSEAMVMCASTPEKVEILSPPEDSKPGKWIYHSNITHYVFFISEKLVYLSHIIEIFPGDLVFVELR